MQRGRKMQTKQEAESMCVCVCKVEWKGTTRGEKTKNDNSMECSKSTVILNANNNCFSVSLSAVVAALFYLCRYYFLFLLLLLLLLANDAAVVASAVRCVLLINWNAWNWFIYGFHCFVHGKSKLLRQKGHNVRVCVYTLSMVSRMKGKKPRRTHIAPATTMPSNKYKYGSRMMWLCVMEHGA